MEGTVVGKQNFNNIQLLRLADVVTRISEIPGTERTKDKML